MLSRLVAFGVPRQRERERLLDLSLVVWARHELKGVLEDLESAVGGEPLGELPAGGDMRA